MPYEEIEHVAGTYRDMLGAPPNKINATAMLVETPPSIATTVEDR